MKVRFTFPCGCVDLLDFDKGERLWRCQGGGETPSNGKTARSSLKVCRGGVQYRVAAEVVPTVRYHATVMSNRGAA